MMNQCDWCKRTPKYLRKRNLVCKAKWYSVLLHCNPGVLLKCTEYSFRIYLIPESACTHIKAQNKTSKKTSRLNCQTDFLQVIYSVWNDGPKIKHLNRKMSFWMLGKPIKVWKKKKKIRKKTKKNQIKWLMHWLHVCDIPGFTQRAMPCSRGQDCRQRITSRSLVWLEQMTWLTTAPCGWCTQTKP